MEHTAVQSQDLAIVGYDTKTSILEVAFRSGRVYRYAAVSEKIYQELLNAPSLGAYFDKNIKRKFKYIKIAGK